MVCAHPTILNQVFKGQYKTSNDYVSNRTTYFQSLCDHFTIPNYLKQLDWRTPDGYETCKELFNRVLYYGKFDTWCYDNDLKMVYDEPPSFITNLVDELDEMAEIIKTNNPSLAELIDKKEKKEYDNPKGTIVSWFLQEHERRILEKVIEFLKKKKMIVKNQAVLCFDGVQILDNGKNNEVLLKELELYITKETGFNIKFKIKPFDELFYSDNLDKINVPEVEDLDTNLRLVEDEKEGADILFEELKEDLKYCNNQLFFKNNNVWTSTDKTTYSCVMDYVMSSNIKTIDCRGCGGLRRSVDSNK
jgi:hypothetical protein